MGEHGYELRPGPWSPPAIVPHDMAVEARARLEWVESVMLAPAGGESIRKWLLALGASVASTSALTVADVEVKVGALLAILGDYPSGCFTRSSLKRAAMAHKFFPSAAELSKVLDAESAALKTEARRLRAIASVGSGQGCKFETAEPRHTGPRTLAPEIESMLAAMRADRTGPDPIAKQRRA